MHTCLSINRLRAFFLALSVLSVALLSPGCSNADKPLPVAEWQFIDAETLKPIEGGWINFAWRGKPRSNGTSSCPRGVLGRTGKDGWFRTTAKDPTWRVDPIPYYFVPGYENFEFAYGDPDPAHITAYVPYDVNLLGTMPTFEQHLRDMGYVYHQPLMSDRWSHHFTKIMPSLGFHELQGHKEIRQRYFIKYRSFPEYVEQNFSFMGKQCDDEGSDNIGLEFERIKLTDRLRAISSTKYFCDPIWNGVKRPVIDLTEWMRRAGWLFKDPYFVWKRNIEFMPDRYQNWSKHFDHSKPLNQSEHASFCSWILPVVAVVEKTGELQ